MLAPPPATDPGGQHTPAPAALLRPWAQGWQAASPKEKVCAGQGRHSEGLLAPAALALPAGQRLHTLLPGAAQRPAAQHTCAPLELPEPLRQGAQTGLPGSAKVFAGHCVQLLPSAVEVKPPGQGLQLELAFCHTEPAGQRAHAEALLEPVGDIVRGGHCVQAAAPAWAP
jgi:hypothetical protein